MRVISTSVDGIRQAAQRGLFDWMAGQDAEIICLQDLRESASKMEESSEFELKGYSGYFFDSPEADENGVAIYTRSSPKAVMFGFGLSTGEDLNGRYLQADFERLSVISLLTPDGRVGETAQIGKMDFLHGLQSHLLKISRKRREYIICANLNIAHTEVDIENPAMHVDESGYLDEERLWLDQLYQGVDYVDAFRKGNADTDEFSWWPSGEIGTGDGWRTDTQIVSKSLSSLIEYAVIYKAKVFSSHAPIIVDYDIHEM
jgi:exodeoxyribonuclease III